MNAIPLEVNCLEALAAARVETTAIVMLQGQRHPGVDHVGLDVWRRPWQDEHEGRADAETAHHVEVAAHPAREVARDRQSEARAGDALMIGHAIEALEHVRSILGADARPLVAHGDDGHGPVEPGSQLDVDAVRAELQRIRGKVRDDLLDPASVADCGRHPARRCRHQGQPAIERDRHQGGFDGVQRLRHREWLRLERHRPGVDARQLEEVADELGHRADDGTSALEEFPDDVLVVNLTVEDQVEIARQPRQRRPQLVGDGGDVCRPLRLGRAP